MILYYVYKLDLHSLMIIYYVYFYKYYSLPFLNHPQVSLVARGHRTSHGLADGMVSLNIDSPVTDDVHFRLHVKKQEGDGRTDVGVTVCGEKPELFMISYSVRHCVSDNNYVTMPSCV